MKKLIIYLILFLVSCSPEAKFILTGDTPSPYSGKYYNEVRVFLSPPKDLRYLEIGFIIGSGDKFDSWTDIISKMQKEAHNNYANGIILISYESDPRIEELFPQKPVETDPFGKPIPNTDKNLYAIVIQVLP